jgi:hypothetical protein
VGDPHDAALAEYNALRAEILAIQQSQNMAFTAALTIMAAVAGVALAKSGGRSELLMILPIVLSGLGLIQVQSARETAEIGRYMREELWQRLTGRADGSWEHYVEQLRGKPSGYLANAVLARALIFVAPSVASIVITSHQRTTHLAPLWWVGIGCVALFVALGMWLLWGPWAGRRLKAVSEARKRPPR